MVKVNNIFFLFIYMFDICNYMDVISEIIMSKISKK